MIHNLDDDMDITGVFDKLGSSNQVLQVLTFFIMLQGNESNQYAIGLCHSLYLPKCTILIQLVINS